MNNDGLKNSRYDDTVSTMQKKETGTPLISIIVPTYQRSDMLPRAVESILAQTYPNVEIVVVDDNEPGSEYAKATHEVLQAYAQNPQIKVITTSGRSGGGKARNFGIRHCTGEYVAFLDDDDRFLPEKLEKQLRFMQENDLDMSYQDVMWHDQNDRLVEYRRMDRAKGNSQRELLRAHILYSLAPTAIYMIKREALLRTEGFGEVKRGQDFILMLRCIQAGLKIDYMPSAYVVQYLHQGERISKGKSFIGAQRDIYTLQKSYSDILTQKERRYIDFRFNCVCAFASMRGKEYLNAIPYAFKAVCISPADCLKEAKRYLGGRRGMYRVL